MVNKPRREPAKTRRWETAYAPEPTSITYRASREGQTSPRSSESATKCGRLRRPFGVVDGEGAMNAGGVVKLAAATTRYSRRSTSWLLQVVFRPVNLTIPLPLRSALHAALDFRVLTSRLPGRHY